MSLISDFSADNFESNSKENGFTYWLASVLMEHLGYETWQSFSKAINKAMVTCNTLSIPIMENFVQIEGDFKLSRFACYLIVMNADSKKIAVARAQAYFATLAGAVQNYIDEASQVERLNVRTEVSEREQSLAGVAQQAGLVNFANFQSAGYRGMYNCSMTVLKNWRNIPAGRTLLDFMGKEELAANLFRITQTELKIKQDNIRGQMRLEGTAETIGRKVRNTMLEISGIPPENFKAEEDIKEVKKELKSKSKSIKLIDDKKNKKQ